LLSAKITAFSIVCCNSLTFPGQSYFRSFSIATDAVYYAGLRQLETLYEGRVQEAWRPQHIFYYIQYRHLTPDLIVDVSSTFEESRKGVRAFASQFWQEGDSTRPATLIKRKEFLGSLEARARSLGEQIGTLYGEGLLTPSTTSISSFTATFPEPRNQ